MSRHDVKRSGEYVEIEWDYDRPYEVVRGHIGFDWFKEVVSNNVGKEAFSSIVKIDHQYCLWTQEGDNFGQDCMHRIYDLPGRGRFKVTVGYYG